jgi:hypothetical protein
VKRPFIAVLAVCLATAPCAAPAAAPSSVEARIDRSQLRHGESLTLQIRLRGEAADERPDFAPLGADFDVVSIQPLHRTTIVNGVRDMSVDWTLELRPRREGALEIPALEVAKEWTPPLAVEVTAGAEPGPAATTDAAGDPVFVEVEVSDPSPYEQQRVIATVRLWATSAVIDGALDDLKLADAVVESLGEDRRSERVLGGVPYTVIERVYSLLPQRSGELELPALHFNGRVREARPRASRRSLLGDLFADGLFAPQGFGGSFDLFDRFAAARRVVVASRALTLDVQPRPAAVLGSDWLPAQSVELSEEWQSDPPVLRAGEATNRRLVIRAKGVAAAQLPDLPPSAVDGVKQYAEQPSVRADAEGAVKSVDTTVIPTRAGTLTLPPVEIAWWDTNSDEPRRAVIPARRVEVLPGSGEAFAANGSAQGVVAGPPPADAPELSPSSTWTLAWRAPIAAVVVAVAVASLVLVRRRRAAAGPSTETARRSAERALRRACRGGDAARAEAALRTLLHASGAVGSDLLAREVARLAAVRYSRDGAERAAWTGRELWKAYRAAGRQRRVRRAAPMLPPLYPEAGPAAGGALREAG